MGHDLNWARDTEAMYTGAHQVALATTVVAAFLCL